MKEKHIKYLAIFLILLVSLAEIHAKNDFIKYHHSILKNNPEVQAENTVEDVAAPRERRELAIKDTSKPHPREKRSVAGVVTALVGIAMVSSLTVEIVATVTECCGLVGFTHLCDRKDYFYKVSDEVDELSDEIDWIWTNVNNLAEYLESTNTLISELWLKMEAIDNQTAKVITSMDSSVEASVALLTEDIESDIAALNETIVELNDISFKYDTVFDNLEDDLWRIHGFISMPLTYGFKLLWAKYWQNIATQELLRRGWSITGESISSSKAVAAGISIKAWFKSTWLGTKINNFMSRFSAETRAKIKTAAVVLIGLANIAIEAWNIVKTVERCEDLEDDIEDAIRKAEDAKDGAEQLKAEVQEIETNFTITYTDLVAQLYTDAVEEYLVNIQSYASASADYSTSMAARVATIQAYIDGIDAAASSNKDDVITLITNLNSALGELGNSLICYEAKYNTLNYVVESCQAGSSKTLAKLFDDKNGTVNELCKDDGYLTQEDIVEIATLKLTNLSYATECIANSEIASDNICGAWRTGKSNSEIVSEYGYSLTAVEIVVAKCAEGEVTDEIKEAICELRSAARTLTYVHELYEHYIDAEVTSAFEACAPPALSDQDKEDICALKYSKTLEYVKSLYELYDPTEVETVYTECVVAEISTAHKAALCSLKKLAATGYNTSSFLATYHNLYGEAAVTAYFSSIDADTCSTTASDTMEEDHYHKSSPSQSFDVDLNDLQALSKVNSQHDEVQNKELTKERKMEIFADVLNEFPDDKKQRLKDIIKEEIETRRQRILKKLKDRLGH